MQMPFKLGSLFDGSGGFPLAGSLCGIEPRWAAEVEPYPIAVTRSRFPNMRHLGDISKVSGKEIEPVDIITFGSPCQDLSVAGKRAGLKHEDNGDDETTRSGLFMEAVRIIKEMRAATNGLYPTFALWENVPGAFSSNKGEDFRIVLEELIKIVEPAAVMPPVPKAGWSYADSFVGDGWSLAYRVFDAQYWGVPQRRRRIHIVLDLRGERAREVLFEREGLRGYFAQGGTPWQETAADAEGCAGATNPAGEGCLFQPLMCYPDVAHSLTERHDGLPQPDKGNGANIVVQSAGFKSGNSAKAHGIGYQAETAPTLAAAPSGTNRVSTVVYCLQGNGIDRALTAGCNGKGWKENVCYTLNTIDRPAVAFVTYQSVSGPLMANSHPGSYTGQDAFNDMLVDGPKCVVFDKEVYNSGINATGGHYISEGGPAPSLRTEHPPAICVFYIVRRLTPTECARLQGFADRWGHIDQKDSFTPEEYHFWRDVYLTKALIDGTVTISENGDLILTKSGKPYKQKTESQLLTWYNRLHTDSAEYKMWGNGIALPPALYCMQGMLYALCTAWFSPERRELRTEPLVTA